MGDAPDVIRPDGTLWRASHDPDNPMAGLFDRNRCFFFRQVKRNPARIAWEAAPWWRSMWFRQPPEWIDTGLTWEGGHDGFDAIGFVPLDPKTESSRRRLAEIRAAAPVKDTTP